MLLGFSLAGLLRPLLFALAHLYGGSVGAAILTTSLLLRLALLPLALRMARAGRERARKLQLLRPELDRLRARFASQPERLQQETSRRLSKHGVELVDRQGCAGAASSLVGVMQGLLLRRSLAPVS